MYSLTVALNVGIVYINVCTLYLEDKQDLQSCKLQSVQTMGRETSCKPVGLIIFIHFQLL